MGQEASARKQRLSFFGGFGRSSFVYTDYSFNSTFPTLEFRLGALYSIPIVPQLRIKTGLISGAKVKRKPLNENQSGDFGYQNLDQVVSGSSHWFVEVPMLLQYDFRKELMGIKDFFGIRTGLSYRMFGNRSVGNQDFFQNKSEPLVIAGFSFKLNKSISIGLDYYKGITNITSGQTFIAENPNSPSQPTLYDFAIKNRLVQIGFEYRF